MVSEQDENDEEEVIGTEEWPGWPIFGLPLREDTALSGELCSLRDDLHRLAAEASEDVVTMNSSSSLSSDQLIA